MLLLDLSMLISLILTAGFKSLFQTSPNRENGIVGSILE